MYLVVRLERLVTWFKKKSVFVMRTQGYYRICQLYDFWTLIVCWKQGAFFFIGYGVTICNISLGCWKFTNFIRRSPAIQPRICQFVKISTDNHKHYESSVWNVPKRSLSSGKYCHHRPIFAANTSIAAFYRYVGLAKFMSHGGGCSGSAIVTVVGRRFIWPQMHELVVPSHLAMALL